MTVLLLHTRRPTYKTSLILFDLTIWVDTSRRRQTSMSKFAISCACLAFAYGRSKYHNLLSSKQYTDQQCCCSRLLATLVYGCETWFAYRRHVKVFEHIQHIILRAIPMSTGKIVYQRSHPRSGIHNSIEAHIVRSKVIWAGRGPGACEAHARYASSENTTVFRAIIWQAENRWIVESLNRQTESQPKDV